MFKTTLARSWAVAKIFKVMNQNFPEQNHIHFSLLPAPARLDIFTQMCYLDLLFINFSLTPKLCKKYFMDFYKLCRREDQDRWQEQMQLKKHLIYAMVNFLFFNIFFNLYK